MRALNPVRIAAMLLLVLIPLPSSAQDIPADYAPVLATLDKKGDFKDGVLKVNIPRGDLSVTINGRAIPTPFGFGGWVSFTKGDGGHDVMMGDLVLTEDEVNPVMSALLDSGVSVTALHNHFFGEQPRIFYMHVHATGTATEIAAKLKPAVDLIASRPAPTAATGTPMPAGTDGLDGVALAKIVGVPGEQSGPVYKITIGRPDIDLREHGARIGSRMGLNTWAAFAGTDRDAMVAGDFAMLENELTAVLRALRANGLSVVAIHNHMTGVKPAIVFLHYFGAGEASRLAAAVRAGLDQLDKTSVAGR
jgi:Domain of Unknown Function (DUF1259)